MLADQAKAFEAHRPQDAAANMEETSRLANLYRHGGPSASAPIRARSCRARRLLDSAVWLARATEAFDAVIARQGRALTRAAETHHPRAWSHAIACTKSPRNAPAAPLMAEQGGKPNPGPVTAVTLNQRA